MCACVCVHVSASPVRISVFCGLSGVYVTTLGSLAEATIYWIHSATYMHSITYVNLNIEKCTGTQIEMQSSPHHNN